MARIRSIKPEFPQSESMGNVSRDARLTFIQLWTIADDEGRLRGNSRMLASLLFPYDDDAPALIDGWLAELEGEGCIQRYKSGAQSYIQLCNWLIHQKIDKPSKSKIPPFESPREDSRNVVVGRDQGKDQGGDQGKDLDVGQNPPDVVAEIFAYWQKTMKTPKSVLDKNRIKLINDALKSYSPADLCKAIRGCSKSPYNMGQNEQKTKYNGLGLILRNAEKIDRFIELDNSQAVSAHESLEDRNARIIAEVMQDVRDTDDNTIEMEA